FGLVLVPVGLLLNATDGFLEVVGAHVPPAEVSNRAGADAEPAQQPAAAAGSESDRTAGDGGDDHGRRTGLPQGGQARLVGDDDAGRDVLVGQVVGHFELARDHLGQVPVGREVGVLVVAHDEHFWAAFWAVIAACLRAAAP